MSVATSLKPSVEAAIQNVFSNFEAAWDKHDAKALAAFFAEDGDLITPEGRLATGRQEIERLFQDQHTSRFKNSRMSIKVNTLRSPTSDIAIVTENCEISGLQDPSGNGPGSIQAIATFVLQNERGKWSIVSARPMVPVVAPR